MANKIQVKRGLKANLPVLSQGEPALCTDTEEIFFGSSKSNIEVLTKGKIINNLTTGGAEKVLSAEQGKVINNGLNGLKTRFDNMIGNALYLSDYPNHSDYSALVNAYLNDMSDKVIVCEPNKEYRFNSPLIVKGKIKIVGNDSTWRYMGTGSNFFTFIEAPWTVEGSTIQDLVIWCNEKSVGAYQNKYCFNVQGYHMSIKFHNLKIYNFGYPWHIKDSDNDSTGYPHHTFGHTISECNVWGFIIAVNCRGNAEQVLISHCWFDDGLRTGSSQNSVIRAEDVTSFWIKNCIIQNADIGVLFKGVRNGEISNCHFENMIDASIWMYPSSAYDNRNNLILNNFLVGGKRCIYFYTSSTQDLKNIHTHIVGNYFAYLGDSATYVIAKNLEKSESHTMMLNNSKENGAWTWYPSTMTTQKEFQ